jgi:hypothetical protein
MGVAIGGHSSWCFEHFYDPFFFRMIFILYCIGVVGLLITSTCVACKTYLERQKDQQPGVLGLQNFNNQSQNHGLATISQYIATFSVVALSGSIPLIVRFSNITLTPIVVAFMGIPFQITIGILVPILFYVGNSEARQYFNRQFWEKAPDWAHQFNPDRVIEINI